MLAASTAVIVLFLQVSSTHSLPDPGAIEHRCKGTTCIRIMTVFYTRADDHAQEEIVYACYLAARDQEIEPCPTTGDCSAASTHPCFKYERPAKNAKNFTESHCPMRSDCEPCLNKKYCAEYTVKPFGDSRTPLQYLLCSWNDVRKICPSCACYSTTEMNQINSDWKNPVLPTRRYIARLANPDDPNVGGTITFDQHNDWDPRIFIKGEVHGIQPGLHGLRVHAYGDITGPFGCTSAGGHFDPFAAMHGGQRDKVRHVGDLGNIEADSTGVATIDTMDALISLSGEANILGRSVVINQLDDVFGAGGHTALCPSAENAWSRVACGVIGIGKLN